MSRFFWPVVALALTLSRLAHTGILWADEDYHLAAAIQMLHGKVPYRDFWYDKPPLGAFAALLFGAQPGWMLRVASAAVALLACVIAFRLARELWGEREGYWAAGLLGFFQTFDYPAAVIPWEPDTLMILPHLAAIYAAVRGRWLWAGAACAAAFLLNPKGLLVLLACLLFARLPALPRLALGFAIPCALVAGWLAATGAFSAYIEQVWKWGMLYASMPGSDPQAQKGWMAVLGWAGFHAGLIAGALYFWARPNGSRWKLAAWVAIMLASTLVGSRFAPRYFDATLAALVIPAARGTSLMRNQLVALLLLLFIPLARFGPRYAMLGAEAFSDTPHTWQDVAMDQESRRTAAWINQRAKPGDTITIWGYRPNVVAYTRLQVAGRFWDSQPLTGVPADRHLSDARPLDAAWAERNRRQFLSETPTFLVDGLSGYNPALDLHAYPDLREWLTHYCESAREGLSVIYVRCR